MTRSDANPPTPDPTRVHVSPSKDVPAEIGGYTIHRVIGAGGMAVVYAAQQQRPKRVVALKVMKTSGDARRALHRFRREIEILGKLRHPYIAQVYDAGTHLESGVEWPFYVMEYVPGAKDILVYAHLKDLSLRDRLKLFVRICAAVEHGHRAHVIHRDLKPGNILIDSAGEPKIIDFGVARAMESEISATTQATEEGRLVGTIQYMAPEQLEARVQDVDARIDVYALGAVLFKLIAGRLPHELDGLTLYTAIQLLREEDPPKPSELNPEVKGDLETIMLKAIAKDRTRRYRSAGSLGRDLVRFLADKPIHARPASIGYRLRLFIKRNRIPLAAASVVAVILLVAGGIVAYERWRPQHSLDQARSELEQERAARAAAEEALRNAPTGVPEDVPADSREAFTFAGHRGVVTALVISPDGGALISGSDDRTTVLWNVESRQRLDVADHHDATIARVALSTDGTHVASADRNGVIAVADATNQQLVRMLRNTCQSGTCLALSTDGRRIAFGCDDLTLRIREVDGSGPLTVRGTTGAFSAATFGRDGGTLLAGSTRGAVYLVESETGTVRHRLEGLEDEVVLVGNVAGDANHVVALDQSGRGHIWSIDAAAGTPVVDQRFVIGNGRLTRAALDPTGRVLAATVDQSIFLLDLETNRPIGDPIEHARMIYSIAVMPSLDWVAVGDAIGEVTFVPIGD